MFPLVSGSPGLSKVPVPGVSQDIALHAAPADRTSAYLVSAFPVHSNSFPQTPGDGVAQSVATASDSRSDDPRFEPR